MLIKDRIKNLRKEKKLTQTELGNLTSLSIKSISTIETGRSDLSTEQLKALSSFFNVSADYLLTGKERTGEISEEEMEILNVLREDKTMRNAMMEITKAKKKAINYLGGYTHNHAHAA